MRSLKCSSIYFLPSVVLNNYSLDLNGKKFAWQGVALLPFVDEDRLHEALKPVYPNLTEGNKAARSSKASLSQPN